MHLTPILWACLLGVQLVWPAAAEDNGKWSAGIGIHSDYVDRGVSQSNSRPALQASTDFSSGSFYAGVWASSIDTGSRADAEVQIYTGLSESYASGFGWDVGVTAYVFPREEQDHFLEVKAGLLYEFERDVSAGAFVHYDFDHDSIYVEGRTDFALTERLTGHAAFGNTQPDDGENYSNWSIGAEYQLTDQIAFGARYTDTDIDDASLDRLAGETFIVHLTRAF